MAITGISKEVVEFVKALGLDPSKTQDITIHIPLDGAVRLEIEELVKDEEMEKTTQVIKNYNIQAIEEISENDEYESESENN